MNIVYKIGLLIGLLLCGSMVAAQPMVVDEEPIATTAPSLIGVTILGNPALSFSSVNDYQNGVLLNHNTLQLTVSLGLTWSLQVRATGDLRYQTNSIPVSAIGVQSVSLGSRPEVFLSTTDQTLASGLATSLLSAIMLIRYRTTGGPNFLKPAGSYTTGLVFTYSAL
ncbi:hypothetical protein [Spirosoma agri]|uniref:DUF4402 domain-containing protein n=1 Tax=Spirosoma agri TaxID=1987381 RepID=A0A6M0IDW7_9BACT|nr:hypothetical protein [Spirosoma agri]NEU65541.1 hypothetical protein [Spirosoma agri]